MPELLIFILVNILPVLVSPQMQEIISEQFQLSFELLIVLLHRADILFQSLNICLLHFLEVEFENLNSELHLCIVVKLDAIEFVLVDPSLELVDVLGVQICLAFELILGHGTLYAQV